MEIWTYQKANANSSKAPEWVAYIFDPDLSKHTLPVRFEGATKQEAVDAARAEYNKRAEHREQVKANREEARQKRAEREERKKANERETP